MVTLAYSNQSQRREPISLRSILRHTDGKCVLVWLLRSDISKLCPDSMTAPLWKCEYLKQWSYALISLLGSYGAVSPPHPNSLSAIFRVSAITIKKKHHFVNSLRFIVLLGLKWHEMSSIMGKRRLWDGSYVSIMSRIAPRLTELMAEGISERISCWVR